MKKNKWGPSTAEACMQAWRNHAQMCIRDSFSGLIDELHAALGIVRCTGKAGVVVQAVVHLVQHGFQAMELILIQRAGQLGDAFLVELVQTVVQSACAVIQLTCTGVQGVHAVIQLSLIHIWPRVAV